MTRDELRPVPAEDQLAILQVLYQYCRSMDRMDRELALACFDPAARLVYSDNFVGDPAGFVTWLWPVHAGMINHVHTIGNVTFASGGPDTAMTEAQVRVTLRFVNDGTTVDLVGLGRYLDRWGREGMRWVIRERTYVSDMTNLHEVGARDVKEQLGRPAGIPHIGGARDRSDPSYAVLQASDPG